VEQARCMGVAVSVGNQGAFFLILPENPLVSVRSPGTRGAFVSHH
jgi:hypothetical protein